MDTHVFPSGLCSCCGKAAFVEGEDYVVRSSGCWEWIGSCEAAGYGRLTFRHQRWKAHRLSYVFTYGVIPDGQSVHHTCVNPPCINPAHLEAIGQREHFNGHRSPEWYANRKAKPTPAMVVRIRELKGAGWSNGKIAGIVECSRQYVTKVLKHQMWSEGIDPEYGRAYKLEAADKERIRVFYGTGEYSQTQLGAMFGVTQVRVSQIVREAV